MYPLKGTEALGFQAISLGTTLTRSLDKRSATPGMVLKAERSLSPAVGVHRARDGLRTVRRAHPTFCVLSCSVEPSSASREHRHQLRQIRRGQALKVIQQIEGLCGFDVV